MSFLRLKLITGRSYSYLSEEMREVIEGIEGVEPTNSVKRLLLRLAMNTIEGLPDEGELLHAMEPGIGIQSMEKALILGDGGDLIYLGQWFLTQMAAVHWELRCWEYHTDLPRLDAA